MSQEFVTRKELETRLASERENVRGWITTAVSEASAGQKRELDAVLQRFTSVVDRLSVQVIESEAAAKAAQLVVTSVPDLVAAQLQLFDEAAERRINALRESVEKQGLVLQRYQSYERIARSGITAGFRGLTALITGPRLVQWIRRLFSWSFIFVFAVLVCAAWFALMN